jgi:hypothetical protein
LFNIFSQENETQYFSNDLGNRRELKVFLGDLMIVMTPSERHHSDHFDEVPMLSNFLFFVINSGKIILRVYPWQAVSGSSLTLKYWTTHLDLPINVRQGENAWQGQALAYFLV